MGTDRRRPLGVDARPAFARPRDLAPLLVRHPVPGRFVLGRVGRRLVATENRHRSRRPLAHRRRRGDRGAVALIGPSRSGKTAAAVAGILEWDGPAVLASVKADLLGPHHRLAAPAGAVPGVRPHRLHRAGQRRLVAAAGRRRPRRRPAGRPRPVRRRPPGRHRRRRRLLAGPGRDPAVGAAVGRPPRPTRRHGRRRRLGHDPGPAPPTRPRRGRTASSQPTARPIPTARRHADAARAARCLVAIWALDDRTRSGVYATAQTVVWPWADPGVAAAARTSDIDLDWLLGRRPTPCTCAPPSRTSAASPPPSAGCSTT